MHMSEQKCHGASRSVAERAKLFRSEQKCIGANKNFKEQAKRVRSKEKCFNPNKNGSRSINDKHISAGNVER